MFNGGLRKEAESDLRRAVDLQKKAADRLNKNMTSLFEERQLLKGQLDSVFDYINSMKNTPEEIVIKLKKLNVGIEKYQGLLDIAQEEYKKTNIQASSTAVGGVAAGVGVAALAPAGVMALATTFGTASTGVAISTLSGAAATNAALAVLGGGALTAGGAGMAGGEALLAMAGPIGWAIGGTAIVGGSLLASGKNKKAAEKMFHQASQVEAAKDSQNGMSREVKEMINITKKDTEDMEFRLKYAKEYPKNFKELDDYQISKIGTLVNNAHTAVNHLNLTLNEDGEFGTV